MSQSHWTKNAAPLCLELGEDDGVLLRKKSCHKTTRKQFQLCKEAGRVFSLVLAGETGQPLLRDVWVLSVEPDGNGQTLCVNLAYAANDKDVTTEQILNAITLVQGQLRNALARAINRKRTPMLNFRVVA